ncbi:hypothetical protein [Bradyrhizobium sp. USDA 4502]
MKLSDFSSVLQLGVGLHTGTVLLQSIAEFASAPLSKKIERLVRIARLRRERFKREQRATDNIDAILDELLDAQTNLELKKVQLFSEYKIGALINVIFAVFLYYYLACAAMAPETDVGTVEGWALVLISVSPATLTLIVLAGRWFANTGGVRTSVKGLESKIFAS